MSFAASQKQTIMKPNHITSKSAVLNTDCNYHAPILCGACGDRTGNIPSRSFWRFSRDYFASESDRSFATEAALFVTLFVTVAIPLLQNANAIRHLLHAFSA